MKQALPSVFGNFSYLCIPCACELPFLGQRAAGYSEQE
jgi:hypothetical protein